MIDGADTSKQSTNTKSSTNVRRSALMNPRSKVSLRTLKDTSERILGDGSKVKGAIKKIFMTLQRMPKTAIEQWKKYNSSYKD